MPFRSFAQNAEDVILWRVFKEQPDGFYIDVGASGPDDSITRVFYERGWRGLNLEPLPHFVKELQTVRPLDTTLQMAVSNQSGQATLYTSVDAQLGGLSTLDPEQSTRLEEQGYATTPIKVPMATLAEICEAHVRRPIDFLKIDVEGHEKGVIEGADWTRWRPRILVVEATEPMSPKPCHQSWEPLLLKAGYLLTLFDGLNRFYVREEDRHLLDLLSTPANVFDDYFPSKFTPYIQYLEKLIAERDLEIVCQRDRMEHEAHLLREAIAAQARDIFDLNRELHRYMSPSGLVWWAKHRAKLVLGRQSRAAG